MHLELSKIEPCWVVCEGAAGKLLTTIKAGVRPHSFRVWEPTAQRWHVHYRWLPWVVATARGQGWTVDYSALPDPWQMLVAGAQEAAGATIAIDPTEAPPNPFEALHVTEDAPIEVVKAAYRALVHKHHPDQGGNEDDFRRVDAAYRSVMRLRTGL